MTAVAEQEPKIVQAEFPEALSFLFEPARYKILYGGRGGAKSWGIARALLIQGTQKQLRILCAREIQNSIKDSVHTLLEGQIKALGFEGRYEITNNEIRGINGTKFFFEGLRYNALKIKSYENIDRVWVEEAQAVSKSSWDILIPTIRKEDSEIWVSFNPEIEEDETYQRFVKNPPKSAIVKKLNFTDNPWFPAVLRVEKDDLKEKDYDAYLHVWEGHCRLSVEGAVYAKELRAAKQELRIARVPHAPGRPVFTFWDLGHADLCAIWFIQYDGLGVFRVIDFFHDRFQKVPHYVKALQDRQYVYGGHYLPHDGNNETLAGKSIKSQLESFKLLNVVVVPIAPVFVGIDAVRSLFPLMCFDEDKCADGLAFLRRYKYKVSAITGNYSREPQHDDNSHAADALRTFAMGHKVPTVGKPKPKKERNWLLQ